MLAHSYFTRVRELLESVEETQFQAICKAADAIVESIRRGRTFHLFGTGHSHLIAEEAFCRAGGLVPVNAILEPALMLHEGPFKATAMERLEGYAEVIADHAGVREGDTVIVISNSGRNVVPVEMALASKSRGAVVVALTSLAHSRKVASRHSSGKRLFEVADIVIDNCGVFGDAVLSVDELPTKVCPASTVTGAAIINALVAEVVERLIRAGIKPPVFISSNVEGGDEHNQQWEPRFAGKPAIEW
ncbi:MAG: SIS domain-containing protein [Bacillota bacterium]